jgi:hypothetical protein
MNSTEVQLAEYFEKAADLAEHVKRDIQKGQEITEKNIIALNQFIIAANAITDLTTNINRRNMSLN